MFHRRLRLIYILLCAGFLLIGARLFYLQVLQISDVDPDYRLYRRPSWQVMPAPRGAIRDRRGTLLAVDRPILELAVRYEYLARDITPDEPGAHGIITWLDEACRFTGKDRKQILRTRQLILQNVKRTRAAVMRWRAQRKLRPGKIREETVAHSLIRDIPLELAARVEADPERFPGVVIRTTLQRHYPHGPLAAVLLGYVTRAKRPETTGQPIRDDPTIEPGDRIGELGAERRFDPWLRGTVGYYEMYKGRKTEQMRRKILWPARPGRCVTLTLDAFAQKRAEDALAGKMGGVVVLDVRNGDVLVMASAPSYDNNDLAAAFRETDRNPHSRLFLSRAMRDSVPSGSVIKPIVALAAAKKRAVTPATTFDCQGSIQIGRRLRRCSHAHGRCDMTRAIEQSCNIWFYHAGRLAGGTAIANMARQFNWGVKTGIDLPWEWPGHLPTPGMAWRLGDTVNLSIGQGNLRVTPLQVAVLMAAIANGGRVLRPHVLLEVTPPLPRAGHRESPVIRRLDLPLATLRAVREGMKRVPRTGTARNIPRLRALNAAAKTGTAQIGTRGINYAWIAGYAPCDAPRYAYAVVVHRTPRHGAEEAGPVAADVLEALLTPPPRHLAGAEAHARADNNE